MNASQVVEPSTAAIDALHQRQIHDYTAAARAMDRKNSNTTAVLRTRREHPEYTYHEIAKACGVTYQVAYQALKYHRDKASGAVPENAPRPADKPDRIQTEPDLPADWGKMDTVRLHPYVEMPITREMLDRIDNQMANPSTGIPHAEVVEGIKAQTWRQHLNAIATEFVALEETVARLQKENEQLRGVQDRLRAALDGKGE